MERDMGLGREVERPWVGRGGEGGERIKGGGQREGKRERKGKRVRAGVRRSGRRRGVEG